MGTKTNINFLGKGPKQALFQGEIDIRGMEAGDFPLETVISEAENGWRLRGCKQIKRYSVTTTA